MKRITVYAGSREGADPQYIEDATALGLELARREIKLIYGAGGRGMMGAVANACLSAGGIVHGIIPDFMVDLEWAHKGISELEIVEDMSIRKDRLRDTDGFVTLPGGVGTLEEFIEIWSWSALGILQQPLGILNTASYYDPFIEMVKRIVEAGYADTSVSGLLIVDTDISRLLDRMEAFVHPGLVKS